MSLGDNKSLGIILEKQCEDQAQTHCYSCGNEGYCAIVKGIIYLSLGNINNGITEIEHGNQHFRNSDESWNNIVGLVLLGIAYEKNERKHNALIEYKKALYSLTEIYLPIYSTDYKKNRIARALANAIINQKQQLALSTPSTTTLFITDPAVTNSRMSINDNRDYLALFSIPIYGTVEAGLNGELHINHFGDFTIVNKVELKKQIFDVYNVHGTADTDRQVTITTKREHGWLLVHGLSMNGWDLPFNENDYVLFYKYPTASHLDYVIASNADPSGGISLMVKRFDAENNQLLSKSKDTSNPYKPIPLDENHQIVGIVIAVAKPSK